MQGFGFRVQGLGLWVPLEGSIGRYIGITYM